MTMALFFRSTDADLVKAYIHGHYRINKKTGDRIWIDSYTDKRPERYRASFESSANRVTHFEHHMAHGRQREALHVFHDLDHEGAHKLARHLGLADEERHANKKALMESIHGAVKRKRDLLMRRGPYDKEADAKFAATEKAKRKASSKADYADLVDSAVSEPDPKRTLVYRRATPREVAEIKRQSGLDVSGMSHEFSAEALRHALRQHGDELKESKRSPRQRALTKQDLLRLPEVLDSYDHIEVQRRGQNKTSIIYRKRFADGETAYVERAIETSSKNKPRLTTKSVWVVAATGVKSSPAPVSTRDRRQSLGDAGAPGKRAHEMTMAQFERAYAKKNGVDQVGSAWGKIAHRREIESAMGRGLEVSDRVLKDHPDITSGAIADHLQSGFDGLRHALDGHSGHLASVHNNLNAVQLAIAGNKDAGPLSRKLDQHDWMSLDPKTKKAGHKLVNEARKMAGESLARYKQ